MADEPRPVSIRAALNLPPREALQFLAAKGYTLTTNWDELIDEGHERYFTAAKIARLDVAEAIREALYRAELEGVPIKQAVAELQPRLAELGWWGKVTDASLTGTDRPVNIGPFRLRRIFDTNLRTSRAAGLWQRIQEGKAEMPYLRYSAVLDRRTRPEHRAWHGTVLPVDHPWWQTHFPPNGWNCRCTVVQLSERDLERRGLKVTPDADLPQGTTKFFRRATGQTMELPRGIDPGFAYAPGSDYMVGLKPPPLAGPIGRPAVNARDEAGPLAPMPPARTLPGSALVPRDTPDDVAIAGFVDAFNDVAVDVAGVTVFRDVLGEPVIISHDFFRYPDGTSKLRADRKEAINLLALTLQQPDEVWWAWEEVTGTAGQRRFRLTRRYVARFEIDGRNRTAIVAMEVGKDGWKGVTAFTGRGSYADKDQVRGGVLAYRRGG